MRCGTENESSLTPAGMVEAIVNVLTNALLAGTGLTIVQDPPGAFTFSVVVDTSLVTLDQVVDTATRLALTPAERTKLDGVETGAEVNVQPDWTATGGDAAILNKPVLGTAAATAAADYATAAQGIKADSASQPGHGHTSTQITDWAEAVQDTVAAMLTSGSNITLTYDDTAGTLAVTAAGGDAEVMRDTIGAALVGVNGVTVAVNDAFDTITLSVTGLTIAQVSGLQAALDGKQASGSYAASVHTHTAGQISDSTTTGRTLLTAATATAARAAISAAPALGSNDNYVTDAEKAALHLHANKTALDAVSGVNTGDQDLSGLLTTATAPELIRDTMGAALVAGANVTITPDDAADTITVAARGATGLTVSLTVAGWSANSQTVTATGVTATSLLLVAPAPADQAAYVAAGVICTTQGAGTLTFTCASAPTAALDVQVVIL